MKRLFHKGTACVTALLVLLLSVSGAITALAAPEIQVLPGAGQNLLVGGDFEDVANNKWTLSDTVQSVLNTIQTKRRERQRNTLLNYGSKPSFPPPEEVTLDLDEL